MTMVCLSHGGGPPGNECNEGCELIVMESLVEKLTRVANDRRYSNEFIGLMVRKHLQRDSDAV